jgi:hypothetical protein
MHVSEFLKHGGGVGKRSKRLQASPDRAGPLEEPTPDETLPVRAAPSSAAGWINTEDISGIHFLREIKRSV